MSDDDKQTHYDLLHKIERNDRRFRMAQSIFMTVIGLVLVGLIAAQFVVIRNFQDQSGERAKGIHTLQDSNRKLLEENKHLSEQTNRYIQCIAQFFATTDRQDRVLADLDACTYMDGGEIVPGLTAPQNGSTNSPAPTTTQNTPANPGGAGESTTPVTPTPAVPDPVRVFGIPVCVPFTGVCWRQ